MVPRGSGQRYFTAKNAWTQNCRAGLKPAAPNLRPLCSLRSIFLLLCACFLPGAQAESLLKEPDRF